MEDASRTWHGDSPLSGRESRTFHMTTCYHHNDRMCMTWITTPWFGLRARTIGLIRIRKTHPSTTLIRWDEMRWAARMRCETVRWRSEWGSRKPSRPFAGVSASELIRKFVGWAGWARMTHPDLAEPNRASHPKTDEISRMSPVERALHDAGSCSSRIFFTHKGQEMSNSFKSLEFFRPQSHQMRLRTKEF